MSSSSWQISLLKLVSLIVLLPFTISFLYFHYYIYWQNEFCLVGPSISPISGKSYDSLVTLENENLVTNEETIDNQLTSITASKTNTHALQVLYGIYAPQPNNKQKKKRGGDKHNLDRRIFRQKYASHPNSSSSSNYNSYNNNHHTSGLSWFSGRGWPSITQSALMISAPFSQLSKYKNYGALQDGSFNYDHVIQFVEKNDQVRWCLQLSSSASATNSAHDEWCSDAMPKSPSGTIYMYPPSGTWKQTTHSESQLASSTISVSCPAPITSQPSNSKNNRHKQQNSKQNQNVQFLLHNPTTVLLLLLNISLAFQYWNHRVNPSLLSKNYNKILDRHEWWRSFTGATAHFEPLHIGFNMMSLHALGRELEGVNGFNSVIFLVYNIALVIMTTAVMMGMVYARLRFIQYKISQTNNISPQIQQEYQEKQQRLRETSAVGFSAVLFAWMVITTLERNQPTCPIPFLNDVCFSTYSFGVLKFNISPIVQLFFAQFIMPRVSFMGHLAGIVCGFGLHWGWGMPPLEVCSPNVLIGGIFLVGCLWWRRGVVPVRPLVLEESDGEERTDSESNLLGGGNGGEWRALLMEGGTGGLDMSFSTHSFNGGDTVESDNEVDQSVDPFVRSKQKKKERELEEVRRKHKTLVSVRNLIGLITVASFYVFDWMGSLVMSQCILLAYFVFGTQSSLIIWTYTHCIKAGNDIIDPEKQRAGSIWKGFFLSSTIAIAMDAMSLAASVTTRTFIVSEATILRVGVIPAAFFMLARMAVNIIGLVLSSKILHDYGQVGGGIFYNIFSHAISWSKLVGDGIFLSQKTLWTAFEGRGIRLGGGELLTRISQTRR